MSTPIDAFWDELKRRMESPFWWSFIISWLIINWKVVYVTLSWSSQKIDDKIEYIENLYKFSNFLESLSSIAHLFVFPLIASVIAIWWIPILAREYLKKQIQNKEEDDKLKIKEIKSGVKVEKEEQNLIKERTNTKKLEKSQEELWNEEYEKLIKKFPDFWKPLTDLIYKYEWYSKQASDIGTRVFDSWEIELLDTMWLIAPNLKNNAFFNITDKWRFFLKKQSLEA